MKIWIWDHDLGLGAKICDRGLGLGIEDQTGRFVDTCPQPNTTPNIFQPGAPRNNTNTNAIQRKHIVTTQTRNILEIF